MKRLCEKYTGNCHKFVDITSIPFLMWQKLSIYTQSIEIRFSLSIFFSNRCIGLIFMHKHTIIRSIQMCRVCVYCFSIVCDVCAVLNLLLLLHSFIHSISFLPSAPATQLIRCLLYAVSFALLFSMRDDDSELRYCCCWWWYFCCCTEKMGYRT